MYLSLKKPYPSLIYTYPHFLGQKSAYMPKPSKNKTAKERSKTKGGV